MRRIWIGLGVVVTVVAVAAGAVGYRKGTNWKEYRATPTSLQVNLNHADAMIRTSSLSKLPHDLLTVPIAKDVLTEDLAFYYEQHEDRMGAIGAVKRIAYEHDLQWTDRIVASILDEPAEIGLWRDGKGALRHYAIIVERNMLTRVAQEALEIAAKDSQLKLAGEIDTIQGKAKLFALEVNPRRTFLIASVGKRMVVMSDPGMLFDGDKHINGEAGRALAQWLEQPGVLSRQFMLNQYADPTEKETAKPRHTLAVGAPTLAMGYGDFITGFNGLRFDFGDTWSTHAWIDQRTLPKSGLGDPALWTVAPANPSACVVLPLDWKLARSVLALADNQPQLPTLKSGASPTAALEGSALACWYGESRLYSPVFIARLSTKLADRKTVLETLAQWAIAGEVKEDGAAAKNGRKPVADRLVWRAQADTDSKTSAKAARKNPLQKPLVVAVGASGSYVVFSPDGDLVDLVLDTLAHKNPSVADQLPTDVNTLALMTPRRMAPMLERESLDALNVAGDSNLLAIAQTHLPPRMKAFANYPPYRLQLAAGTTKSGNIAWQRVDWVSGREAK